MPNISPAWTVVKSGISYTATPDGSSITHRSMNPSEATIIIDNTNDSYNSTFATEDEVTIKIGSVSMMVGYIVSIDHEWNPSRQKTLRLRIVDWGSYLAGKTIYENNYKYSIPASNVFSNAGAQLIGLTTNITTGLTASDKRLKREFYGTYVKDHWFTASEVAGAEFFVDENKVLQVFPHKSPLRALTAPNTLRYKIQDTPSTASNEITVRLDRLISYSDDSTNQFRNVTVTNGIYESFPENPHAFTDPSGLFPFPENGAEVPYNFGIFGSASTMSARVVDWNPSNPTTIKPITVLSNEKITYLTGSDTEISMPIYQVNIGSNTMEAVLSITSIDKDGTHLPWRLNINDWDYLTFVMKVGLSPAPDTVNFYFYDNYPTRTYYYVRNIYNDLLKDTNGDDVGDSRSGYVVLEYNLEDLIDNTKWYKNGTPTQINAIGIEFLRAGSKVGYTAGTSVNFGYFHFWRKRKSTATSAGTPATEKIIVDASAQSIKNLTNLAVNELNRTKNSVKKLECTISGNTNFKKPGYIIDFDLQTIFGAGKSQASARLDEITHRLDNGIHYTELLINDPLQRN